MFGRKREDDYDAYNEKYASKYDDDYIAPSKEYRSEQSNDRERTYSDTTAVKECDHDHEQTYSDINTVRECDHSHEQTYEDADSEQRPYDDYANLESFFERMLERGEHLIWVGSRKNAKVTPDVMNGQKKTVGPSIASVGLILFITGFCFWPLVIVGGLLIVVGSVLSPKIHTNMVYALTDKRVIISDMANHTSIALKDITKVERTMLGNNMGNVYITTKNVYRGSQRASFGGYRQTLYEINDPARVQRIINDAIHGLF